MTPIPQFLKYDKPLTKYLIHQKFQMSATFSFEKGATKKTQNFHFLKGYYFVMGKPIDMNVDVL